MLNRPDPVGVVTDAGPIRRQRWQRPNVPRPAAPARTVLPSPDAAVPDLDPLEPLTALDHLAMLPQAARVDLARGGL